MKYLKNFNTLLEYEDALILDIPNTSYIVEDKEVKYLEEPRIGNKYILYKSSDGLKITPYDIYVFGTSLMLNEYEDFGLISFKTSVTRIGNKAFLNRPSLTSIAIPNSVKNIGEYAFYWCTSLTSVTIPNNVTRIEYSAFCGCSSLTSVTIGESVKSIGSSAFGSCSSLTSITIPNSVTSIGSDAFLNCSSLTSIDVDINNPNYCSIDGVLFNKDKTSLLDCPSGTTRSEYTIPNSVTSIGDDAFAYCKSLTSITIPNSVTSIGNYAFSSCSKLTSIIIPNSVTSIGTSAFSTCSKLTSITIPNSVTSIGYFAFDGCKSLKTITCEATSPPHLDAGNDLTNVIAVYVPAESVEAYKTATNWSPYASKIKPIQ